MLKYSRLHRVFIGFCDLFFVNKVKYKEVAAQKALMAIYRMTILYRYISTYINIYHHLSPYNTITVYHHMSPLYCGQSAVSPLFL